MGLNTEWTAKGGHQVGVGDEKTGELAGAGELAQRAEIPACTHLSGWWRRVEPFKCNDCTHFSQTHRNMLALHVNISANSSWLLVCFKAFFSFFWFFRLFHHQPTSLPPLQKQVRSADVNGLWVRFGTAGGYAAAFFDEVYAKWFSPAECAQRRNGGSAAGVSL